MGIPTKEEFRYASHHLSNTDRPAVTVAVAKVCADFSRTGKLNLAAIADCMLLDQRHAVADEESAEKGVAWPWLWDQRAYKRAMAFRFRVRKGFKPRSWEQRAEALASRVLAPPREQFEAEYLSRKPDTDAPTLAQAYADRSSRESMVRLLAGALSPKPALALDARIIRSLNGYYYNYAGRVDGYRRLPAALDDVINSLRKSEESASQLADLLEMLPETRWPMLGHGFVRLIGGKRSRLEKARDAIVSLIPLQRLDKTARERLLVISLSKAFRHYYRSPKTGSISDLLLLEGIENQLDARTVERIVKSNSTREAIRRQSDSRGANSGR